MNTRFLGSPVVTGLVFTGMAGLAAVSAQAATTGGLSGVVRDAETKEPLAGVNVVLQPGSLSTVTLKDGSYLFTGLVPGEYTLTTELVSHQAVTQAVRIVQDVTAPLDLDLTQKEREAATIRIRATPPQRSRSATIYGVTRRDEETVRGTPAFLRQYPGDVQGQPGVILDPQGRLHIRGGRTEHTAYFLDGILVSEPNTNGFATNLSTVGLDRLNLISGGISPDYGLAFSGLANAIVRRGSVFGGTGLNVEGGSDHFGSLYLEHGGQKGNTDWYLGGYTFKTRFNNDPSISRVPAFADGVVKITTQAGKNDRLAFFGGKGYARYDTTTGPFSLAPGATPGPNNFAIHNLGWDRDTNSPLTLSGSEGDYSTQGYGILSGTWTKRFSADKSLVSQVYRLGSSGTAQFLSPVNKGYSTRSSDMFALRSDYDGRVSRKVRLRGGVWYRPSDNDQYLVDTAAGSRPTRTDPATGQRGPVGARIRHEDVDTVDAAAYTELEVTAAPKVTLNLGVRHELRHYDKKLKSGDLYIDPATASDPFRAPTDDDPFPVQQALERQRADLALLGDKTDSQTSPRIGTTIQTDPNGVLRLFWGKYVLFAPASVLEQQIIPATGETSPSSVPLVTDYWLHTSRQEFDLKPERSRSIDLSYERGLGFGTLTVSPYWRRHTGLNQRQLTPTGIAEFVNTGEGRSTGVEWKFNLKEQNGWNGWLSYTYAKANATHASTFAFPTDATRPAAKFRLDWDQRHTAALAVSKRVKNWEFSPVVQYGSGFPYGQTGAAGYNPSGFAGWAGGDPRFFVDPSGLFPAVPILGPDGKITSTGPNAYSTGKHVRLDMTLRRYVGRDSSVYLAVQNVLNSRSVLARGLIDPFTRGLRGYHEPTAEFPQGYYTNDVTAREAPRFFALGVNYRF